MYIVVTAYVLNENDTTAGGKTIPIACVRVGRMKKTTKDSFKQVYKDYMSYTYPKISENKLRSVCGGGAFFRSEADRLKGGHRKAVEDVAAPGLQQHYHF